MIESEFNAEVKFGTDGNNSRASTVLRLTWWDSEETKGSPSHLCNDNHFVMHKEGCELLC